MSEAGQGWVVAAVILGATIYLLRKLLGKGGGKGTGCGKCPTANEKVV